MLVLLNLFLFICLLTDKNTEILQSTFILMFLRGYWKYIAKLIIISSNRLLMRLKDTLLAEILSFDTNVRFREVITTHVQTSNDWSSTIFSFLLHQEIFKSDSLLLQPFLGFDTTRYQLVQLKDSCLLFLQFVEQRRLSHWEGNWVFVFDI